MLIYNFTAGSWIEQGKLYPGDRMQSGGGGFAHSIALDGNIMVVGAPADDSLGTDSGAAYVFQRVGGSWQEVVSGGLIVIGAPGATDEAAYVFKGSGASWTQEQRLAGDVGEFGAAVAINQSVTVGTTTRAELVVGAPTAGTGGEVQVFMRSTAGTWSLISNGNGGRLTASDAQSGEHFGDAVAMTSGRIVVGAPDWNAPPWGEDDYLGNGTNKQFAFTSLFASASDVKVFVNGALQTFGADYVLSTPVGGVGATVTLNTAPAQDVRVALVATTPERIGLKPAQPEQGRAFVFDLGASLQTWNRTARLTADAGLAEGDALKEGLSGDHFGASVALDATHVVVGAPDHNESVATQAGAAYVFYNLADQGSGNGASWVRGGGLTSSGAVASGKLTAADPAGSDATFPMPDHFGASVAISGGRVVVGIPGFNQTSGNVITHGDIGAFRTFVEGTLPDLRADASFAEAFAGSATSGFGAKSVYDPVSGELFVTALGENRVYVYKNEGLYWRPVQTLTSPESVYITSAGLTAQYYNSSFIGIPIGLTDFPDFNSADGFFAYRSRSRRTWWHRASRPITSPRVGPARSTSPRPRTSPFTLAATTARGCSSTGNWPSTTVASTATPR